MDRRIQMPKKGKGKTPWLLIAGGAAALWYFFGGGVSASTTTTVSPAAQKYMNQIMTAQNAYLAGQTTQAVYNATAGATLIAAAADPAVTSQDIATLHGVSGV